MRNSEAGLRDGPARGTILLVCRANAARTPLATAMLRRRLAQLGAHGITVVSAGTETGPDIALQPEAQRVAAARGLDRAAHVIRGIDERAVQADLIVTMTESLRDQLTRTWPGLLARSFTLMELDRLLVAAEGPFAGLSDLAGKAHAVRPVTPAPSAPEDVEDPAGKSARFYDRTADTLEALVNRLAENVKAPT